MGLFEQVQAGGSNERLTVWSPGGHGGNCPLTALPSLFRTELLCCKVLFYVIFVFYFYFCMLSIADFSFLSIVKLTLSCLNDSLTIV